MLDDLAGSIPLTENWKGQYNAVLGSTGTCVRDLAEFVSVDKTVGITLLPRWADFVYRTIIDACVRHARNTLSTEVAVKDALRFVACAEKHDEFFERARAVCTAFEVGQFDGMRKLIEAHPGNPGGVRGWRRRYARSRVSC